MVLKNKAYYQEKFSKLTLAKETLNGIDFEECEFRDCSFVDCKVIKCRFINCKFRDCMISAAVPTGSRFVEVSFTDSKVIGVDWTKAEHIREISFQNCQVNYSSFRLLKLPKLKMVSCEVKEADFTGADLSESTLTDTDFEKSIFSKTDLTKANLQGATNYLIDVRFNTVKKARFSLPDALSLLNGLEIIID